MLYGLVHKPTLKGLRALKVFKEPKVRRDFKAFKVQ